MKSIVTAAVAALLMVPATLPAHASSINLVVEGGGTAQVHGLTNGNLLGLWGFDTRNGPAVTVSDFDALDSGFTSGNVVAFYNGTNPVNTGAAEFDPLEFGFTLAEDTRFFDSLWVEWTGGNLVYNFEGQTRTMGATVTRDGDPLAPVPLPAAGWLLLAGLGGLGLAGRRKRKAA